MGSSSGQRDRQAWEAYAQSYDRILPLLDFYQEVVSRHVEALTNPGIRRVIDVGAGTGNVAIQLAARGVRVTAVDLSSEMLEQLRRKMQTVPPGSIEIVEQDAQSLSAWPDAAFDGANVLLALFAMPQPSETLREIMRVVRPGGLVAITETKRDFQLQPLLDFVEDFVATHPSPDDLRGHWERVKSANLVLDPGQRAHRLAVEEIHDELAASGFVVKSVRGSHLGQCATICAEKKTRQ